jgi:hypothetical protein
MHDSIVRFATMITTFEGQCQCGEVKYRVIGTPVTLFACHCTDCQRQSSSAFGMALWVRNAKIKFLVGRVKDWIRTLPSGRDMTCSFCPTCGVRLFHKLNGQTELMSIKPGTLNDTRLLQPVGHIWMKSKQNWVQISPSSLQYSGNPENSEELISVW